MTFITHESVPIYSSIAISIYNLLFFFPDLFIKSKVFCLPLQWLNKENN